MAKTVTLLQGAIDLFVQRQAADKAIDGFRKSTNQQFNQMQQDVQAAMVLVSASIVAGLKTAVSAAAEFSASMAEVNTLGVENLGALKDSVLDLSGAFGLDLTDAAKAAYQALSTGAKEAEVPNILASSAKAARAGVADLSTAVNLGMRTMNAFGGSIKSVDEVFDQAFIALKAGDTNFRLLADSTGKLAPIFNAAGLSSQEMFASIAALTVGGIQTSEAVTSLKAAMSNVIKPTSEAAKAAQELGIDFSVAALKSKGLKGFLDDVAKATHGDVVQMGRLFASSEALAAILSLTGSQAGKLSDVLEEMKVGAGASEEAFRKWVEENPGYSFELLTKELKVLAVVVGTALLPELTKLADWIRNTVISLRKWAQEHEGLVATLSTVIGTIATVVTSLAGLRIALNVVSFSMWGLGAASAGAAGAGGLGLLSAGFTGLVSLIGTAGTAMTGFIATLAPGVAMVTLIGFLGPALLVAVGALALVAYNTFKLRQEIDAQLESHARLGEAIERYVTQLEAQGVAVDRAALQQMNADERIAYLNELRAIATENASAREIEAITGVAATKEQIHRAELARLAGKLSAEEAARVALSAATDEEIRSMQAVAEAAVASDAVKAESAVSTATALEQSFESIRIANQALGGSFTSAGIDAWNGAAVTRQAYTYLGTAIDQVNQKRTVSNEMIAAGIEKLKGAAATEEEILRAKFLMESTDLEQSKAYMLAKSELTDQQIRDLTKLERHQSDAFGKYLNNLNESGKATSGITEDIKEKLKRLSLDHHESPSVNDLARQGFSNYLSMLNSFASQQGGILGSIRQLWLSTWEGIVSAVSNSLAYLYKAAAQAFGVGGGGGGVPAYAGGTPYHRGGYMDVGHGRELVERPTRMLAPRGTRVYSAAETARMMGGGDTNISVSVSVDGGVFLEDARSVDRMAERLGSTLAKRLQAEVRRRGKG